MNWEHSLSVGAIGIFLIKELWTWYKDSMLKVELVNQALQALPKIQQDIDTLKKDVHAAHTMIRDFRTIYASKLKDHLDE